MNRPRPDARHFVSAYIPYSLYQSWRRFCHRDLDTSLSQGLQLAIRSMLTQHGVHAAVEDLMDRTRVLEDDVATQQRRASDTETELRRVKRRLARMERLAGQVPDLRRELREVQKRAVKAEKRLDEVNPPGPQDALEWLASHRDVAQTIHDRVKRGQISGKRIPGKYRDLVTGFGSYEAAVEALEDGHAV